MPLDNRTCFIVNLRDRLACVSCGKGPSARETYHRGFEYHHLQPKSEGGSDDAANIILLCQECHLEQHNHNGVTQPLTQRLLAPAEFYCKHCDARLNPMTAKVNCGKYHCDKCRTDVHLFDHLKTTVSRNV